MGEIEQRQDPQTAAEQRPEGDGDRGVAPLQRRPAEDAVQSVAEAGAEPQQQGGGGNGLLPADAGDQHAAGKGDREGKQQPPGELFPEKQGGKQQHEAGRGIQKDGRDRKRAGRDAAKIAIIEKANELVFWLQMYQDKYFEED